MKRYKIEFSAIANEELFESYLWGLRNWDELAAQRWAREVRDTVIYKLSRFPLRHPIAPESKAFGIDIRHLIIGRYRVLFTIDEETVLILHIRGPYTGE